MQDGTHTKAVTKKHRIRWTLPSSEIGYKAVLVYPQLVAACLACDLHVGTGEGHGKQILAIERALQWPSQKFNVCGELVISRHVHREPGVIAMNYTAVPLASSERTTEHGKRVDERFKPGGALL